MTAFACGKALLVLDWQGTVRSAVAAGRLEVEFLTGAGDTTAVQALAESGVRPRRCCG